MHRVVGLISVAALGVCGVVFAQSPAAVGTGTAVASPTPLPPPVDLTVLTSEDKEKIAKASQAAQQNPEVIAAAVELDDAAKAASAAMIAKDPTLKPLLDKIDAASQGGPRPELTAPDFDHLRAGRVSIQDTPAAKNWDTAQVQYRKIVHKVMLEVDPTLKGVFEKLEKAPGGGPSSGGTSGVSS